MVCDIIINFEILKGKKNVIYASLVNRTSLPPTLADVGAEMLALCSHFQSLQH